MGSELSKNDACMIWCGNVDDANPEQDQTHTTRLVLDDGDTTASLTGQDVVRNASWWLKRAHHRPAFEFLPTSPVAPS